MYEVLMRNKLSNTSQFDASDITIAVHITRNH